MKKIKLGFIALLSVLLVSCGKEKNKASVKEERITSTIVNDEYKLYISLPKGYTASNEYPVVFLLDGDWYIDFFAKELNELIESNDVPPSILVGIGHPDQDNLFEQRIRDYTYPTSADYKTPSGQSDVFHSFLEDELIPNIEGRFSTNPDKYVIMGHSLSGLCVLYNLFQSPETKFSGFVALSSSLWWEDGAFFALEEDLNASITDLDAEVYIAYGSAESGSLAAYNQEMIARLKKRNYPSLRLKTEVFKGASHRQVSWEGLREGAIFTLN